MLQLTFFFFCALIAGLQGVESVPYFGHTPGETFSGGLSPARSGVDEDYYDNQVRAMPQEEDDYDLESRDLESEGRHLFDWAQRIDESNMQQEQRTTRQCRKGSIQCVIKKSKDCMKNEPSTGKKGCTSKAFKACC